MSDTTTIARPYAKALFEHALNSNKLSQWSVILNDLAAAVANKEVKQFISNPMTSAEEQVELLMVPFAQHGANLIPDNKNEARNLISLLAHNKRLMLLPDIKVLFEELRAEQEKTLEVKVVSFTELTSVQQEQLVNSLTKRLKRQVTLSLNIDKSLLGGAVIHAGDLVIDGSVRGKLNKLLTDLAA